MKTHNPIDLHLVVAALVAAAFCNIYLTQPVLPDLQRLFGVSPPVASLTVSAVLAGIMLANLPVGMLADRLPMRPIIAGGALLLALAGVVCGLSSGLWALIAGRFLQGLAIPALTTCLAAFLGRTLPREQLNRALGAYVAATVMGGMGGRLLGGWLENWRYSFVVAGALVLAAAALALWRLPRDTPAQNHESEPGSFRAILAKPEVLRIYVVCFCGMGSFTSLFNYMAFRLAAEPFLVSTGVITAMYLTYLLGAVMSLWAGRLSDGLGNTKVIAAGTVMFALALLLALTPSLTAMVLSLCLACLGFFAMHSAAAGALNRRVSSAQGRANSLYVLIYYVGGFVGVTMAGWCYQAAGWPGVITMCLVLLLGPVVVCLWELKR